MNIKDFEIFKTNEFERVKLDKKYYMLNKQPYLDVVLNDSCNQNCMFCIADLIHDKVNLNLEKAKEQIRYSVENLNVKDILLLGGEPTLSPILIDIIKFCKSLPKVEKIIMTSNGIKLKDLSFANDVFSAGLTNLNISIMSIYEDNRQSASGGNINTVSQLDLADIIDVAHGNNVSVRINNNVFKGNNDSVTEMNMFYREMVGVGADSVKFSPLFAVDKFSVVNIKTEWVRDNILSPERYESLFSDFERYWELRDFNIIENELQFGFVKNTLIPIKTPIIMNWNFGNYTGMMDKVIKDKQINNIKLLPTGNLSLSWNREDEEWFIR